MNFRSSLCRVSSSGARKMDEGCTVAITYGASVEDAIQKLQYDLYYIKNNSLLFDLAILIQTAEVVLFGKGAR